MSQNLVLSGSISSLIAQEINQKLSEILVNFTQALVDQGIDKDQITNVWEKISESCQINMKAALFAAEEKQKILIARQKKREEEEKLPRCDYCGPKNKKQCESAGKVEIDGKVYCNPHAKTMSSKHRCVYILGKSSKKREGQECGGHVKSENPCDHDFEVDDNNYEGKWICDKHLGQIVKAMEKEANRCEFIHTSGQHEGDQCKSMAVKDGKCNKHLPKEKKENEENGKKGSKKDSKKGLKKDDKNSDSESEAQDSKKENKKDSKKGSKKDKNTELEPEVKQEIEQEIEQEKESKKENKKGSKKDEKDGKDSKKDKKSLKSGGKNRRPAELDD